MKESSVTAYLGALEAAKSIGDMTKSAQIFEKARLDLFNAEADAEATSKDAVVAAQKYGNPYFEQLGCVGFYPQERRLEAVVHIKRPFGYGGNLGTIGSYEYVGFWVNWYGDLDFNDTGEDVCAGYVHGFDPGAINPNLFPICYSGSRDIIPLPTLRA